MEENKVTGQVNFSPLWLQWFLSVAQYFTELGGGGSAIDHNVLTNLQGGTASEYYHLTSAQFGVVANTNAAVATWMATPSSANLAAAVTGETGTGALVFATSPALVTPALGTPTALVLTNATGLPIATGVSGLAGGVATFLATPSSTNLAAAVTDETGSGALVFATTPALNRPTFAAFTVAGLPAAGSNTDALAIVTDAFTTIALGLGTTVTGGGANRVGVRSDGTNWIYSF